MKLRLLRILLSISTIICLLGISYPSFFHGGTIVTKTLAGKDLMTRIHEDEISQITADYLYNNKINKEDLHLPEVDPDAWEKNFYYCERIRKTEKVTISLCLVTLILNTVIMMFVKKTKWAHLLLLPISYFLLYYFHVVSKGGITAFLINSSNLGIVLLLWFISFNSVEKIKEQLNLLKLFSAGCILFTAAGLFMRFSSISDYPTSRYELVSYFPIIMMPVILIILFMNEKGEIQHEI